jgi:hypothetical protein
MEELNNIKFQPMEETEMDQIYGGGIWSSWKKVEGGHCCNGQTLEQRYNWFGLHGTDDTRLVEDF